MPALSAVAALFCCGGRSKDVAVAAEAARISREGGRHLVGLQVRPKLNLGPLLEIGLDPEELERAEVLGDRQTIRRVLGDLGHGDAPVVLIGRPTWSTAARAAADLGASIVVVSSTWRFRRRRVRDGVRSYGVPSRRRR